MIKGLFKLHFVVALSCAVVGSVFAGGREVALITSDGKEFVFERTEGFIKESITLMDLLSDMDVIPGLACDDKMEIGLSYSSGALEMLISCLSFGQTQMNECVLVRMRDKEFAEAFNLANYLELENILTFLIEAAGNIVDKKNAKRISVCLDRNMRGEFKRARDCCALQEVLMAQQKRERKEAQKRRSIERRRAADEKVAVVEVY